MRFVNPQNDIAFKKIFGNEQKKEILISFLNAVLGLTGDREIEDLEILNPYQVPRIEGLKFTILDVQARDRRGVTFIVEMQLESVAGYVKRFLYYATKAYAGQIKRAEDYPRLNQVIFIGILNFVGFEGEDYLTRHLILNSRTYRQEIQDLEFNFLELPKFTKSEGELETVLDKWVYFLKYAKDLEVIPASADFPALRLAYESANQFGWTDEELAVYDFLGMKAQDERGMVQAAQERGLQQGLQQGRQEGARSQARETARQMLADGLEPTLVMKYTGLSAEELDDLP